MWKKYSSVWNKEGVYRFPLVVWVTSCKILLLAGLICDWVSVIPDLVPFIYCFLFISIITGITFRLSKSKLWRHSDSSINSQLQGLILPTCITLEVSIDFSFFFFLSLDVKNPKDIRKTSLNCSFWWVPLFL